MLGEELSWDALPAPAQPRVALLKLQLRAALREAAEAEAAEAAIDIDAAVAELRGRVEPLFDERRASLAELLAGEQRRAEAAVAGARRAAAVMLAQAAPTPAAASAAPVAPLVEVPVMEPVDVPVMEPVDVPVMEPVDVPVMEPVAALIDLPFMEPVEMPVDVPVMEPVAALIDLPFMEPVAVPVDVPIAAEPLVEPLPPLADIFDVPLIPEVDPGTSDEIRWAAQPPPPAAIGGTNLVVDAEGFARLLATMVAGMVDERLRAGGVVPAPQYQPQQYQQLPYQPQQYQQLPYQPQPYQYVVPVAPSPAAPVEKRSLWKHAWHLDVVLLGISTVIVLVVLAAWLG